MNETEQYILTITEPEDPLLTELVRETHLKTLNPRMLAGHLQGKILETLSRMIRPQRILEIGTFTGYSTICLAKGLQPDGRLHTIEKEDELQPISSKYFTNAGLNDIIICYTGNALDIIPTISDTFDLIYIDGDKREYCQYYELCINKLRPGGVMLADNILWNGKVVQLSDRDRRTAGMLQFNSMVSADPRVSQVILPLRDGLMLILKKQVPKIFAGQ
ncbi:MAG: O-methyltransferase [Bacteroidales bacterium]|jgi:predicted O-methyltransferase YrrM|nr:O-methyltransferase [Bacteroidales bacterium]